MGPRRMTRQTSWAFIRHNRIHVKALPFLRGLHP
jgi:hypothetical protein